MFEVVKVLWYNVVGCTKNIEFLTNQGGKGYLGVQGLHFSFMKVLNKFCMYNLVISSFVFFPYGFVAYN